MTAPSEFICEGYSFEPETGTLSLRYGFDNGLQFEERIVFPTGERVLSALGREALDRVFRLLLLACGVSYYKAFAPSRIRCAAFALDPATAAFFTEFYLKGLAEFAWRNGIELAGRLQVVADAVEPPAALCVELPRRTCVPVGGGKDSIVTIECLKQAGEPLVLFSLGNAAPIDATIRQAALPFIRVTRALDRRLMELNAAGALNGHVPITGILSMIVLACAIICGFDTIAMSNENSASSPTRRRREPPVQQVVRVRAGAAESPEPARGSGYQLFFLPTATDGNRHRSPLRPLRGLSAGVPELQHGVPPVAGASRDELVLRLPEMPLRLPCAGTLRRQASPDCDIWPQYAG